LENGILSLRSVLEAEKGRECIHYFPSLLLLLLKFQLTLHK
jgi:hypothetical protein